MAYYSISEIVSVLSDAAKDGLDYVEISPSDVDDNPDLCFSFYIDEDESTEEFVDAVEIPKGYRSKFI